MTRTRVVGWLRVILPLTALVILSTLFLFGKNPEPGGALPYSDVTGEELAARPQVTAPRFAGVASDGTQVSVTAETASPGQKDGRSSVQAVGLTLKNTDGMTADLTAGEGELTGNDLRLTQDVRMVTSTGWQLVSDEFQARLTEGTVSSDHEVRVQAPFGELTAGGMELRRESDGAGNHVLDLNRGVRMIYRP